MIFYRGVYCELVIQHIFLLTWFHRSNYNICCESPPLVSIISTSTFHFASSKLDGYKTAEIRIPIRSSPQNVHDNSPHPLKMNFIRSSSNSLSMRIYIRSRNHSATFVYVFSHTFFWDFYRENLNFFLDKTYQYLFCNLSFCSIL